MSASTPVRLPPTTQLLLVEPDPSLRYVLAREVDQFRVEPCADLPAARAQLAATSFDLLVTNLRLGAYNGLHLVYLTRAAAGSSTRCLVYTDRAETPAFARDVQRAGAFYESLTRLRYALPAYLHAYLDIRLPLLDRRDPELPDRRLMYRGGRRRSDVLLPAASTPPS